MTSWYLQSCENGFILTVKVVPGSSKTMITGIYDGMLKVKVSAAPEKGKANKCLLEYLAGYFGVKKQQVQLISGQTIPIKHIQIQGCDLKKAERQLVNDLE